MTPQAEAVERSWDTPQVEIVELDAFVVIGIPVEGHFSELAELVPAGWTRLWPRVSEIPGRLTGTLTEVSWAQRDGRYRELLGARVSFAAEVPTGMVRLELPAARYVHVVEHGPVENIAATFGAMQAYAMANDLRPDGLLIDDGYSTDTHLPHSLHVRVLEPS